MIYTCYEMIQDCRNGRPEGWAYFLGQYGPVIHRLLGHYAGSETLEKVLAVVAKPESELFRSTEPAPERWFVAELRQNVLSLLPAPACETPLDLDTVAAALAGLTLLEKQAVWLESMRYDADVSAEMLRMSAQTVTKIRDRALELIRGKVDTWNRNLLSANGIALGRSAAAAKSADCLPHKVFLDVLDGRTNWRGREEMEQHAANCWHCIDHFCRLIEVVELLRGIEPWTDKEIQPLLRSLGVKPEKTRRFFQRGSR